MYVTSFIFILLVLYCHHFVEKPSVAGAQSLVSFEF